MRKQPNTRKIGLRKLRQMLPWAQYVVPLGEQDFYLVATAADALVKCVVPKVLPVGTDGEPFIPGYFQPAYNYDLQIMVKDNRLQVMMATGVSDCREKEDGETEWRFVFRSPQHAQRQLWVGSCPKVGAEETMRLFKSYASGIKQWEMPDPRDENCVLMMGLQCNLWSGICEKDMKQDLWARGGHAEECYTAEFKREEKEQQTFRMNMMEFVQAKEEHNGYIASLSPVRMVELTGRAMAVEIFGITRWYPVNLHGYRQLVQTVATAEHLADELKKAPRDAPWASFDSDEVYVNLFGG